MKEPDWKTRAVCRTVPDPELFFPPLIKGRNADITYAPARRVCSTCTVRMECLAEAMAAEDGAGVQYRAGVWGGLSPNQRDDLYRSMTPRETA